MLSLLILIIFGLGTAYFATQNTGLVHLIFGNYLFSGIPLYVVIIGAMLVGIFISWIISIVNSFSSFMTIHGKDAAIQNERKTVKDLEKKNYELSLEIARLKGEKHIEEHHQVHESPVYHPSFMERIRNSFA